MPTFLRHLEAIALDIPLLEPFGIATGAQELARNVVVRLELRDGTVGWGEAAPFPAVNGETRDAVLTALATVDELLEGQDLQAYRHCHELLGDQLGATPTALSAVECAILDALSRRWGISLLTLFGGRETELHTDITIVTGDEQHAAAAALRAAADGFAVLKVKVGAADLDLDVRRLRAIVEAVPRLRLLLDGNCAYGAADAVRLVESVRDRTRLLAFEQPVPASDLDGLEQVQVDGKLPVIADESLRSRQDLALLARRRIAAVNVKSAKVGLVAAWDLLIAARTLGFDLMVGGMVETELSMSASACLAAGVGGVRYVDLDTPLFLGPRPLRGGFRQQGPRLGLAHLEHGHGVELLPRH